jgi:hypothetical protein
MSCPFSKKPNPSSSNTTDPSLEETMEMSRRTLLGWGALGMGGVLITSVLPGCGSAADSSGAASAATTDSFLTQYDALAVTYAGNIPALIGARGALVKDWLTNHPFELFAELRASRPVLHTGGPVPTILALYKDVADALDKNDVFAVIPYQGEVQPLLDHFTLADTNLPRHDLEKGVCQEAVLSTDGDGWRTMVRTEAEALVQAAKARGDGKIDVVQDLARILPVRILTSTSAYRVGATASPLKRRCTRGLPTCSRTSS